MKLAIITFAKVYSYILYIVYICFVPLLLLMRSLNCIMIIYYSLKLFAIVKCIPHKPSLLSILGTERWNF